MARDSIAAQIPLCRWKVWDDFERLLARMRRGLSLAGTILLHHSITAAEIYRRKDQPLGSRIQNLSGAQDVQSSGIGHEKGMYPKVKCFYEMALRNVDMQP
jgi:hypothetical protein